MFTKSFDIYYSSLKQQVGKAIKKEKISYKDDWLTKQFKNWDAHIDAWSYIRCCILYK